MRVIKASLIKKAKEMGSIGIWLLIAALAFLFLYFALKKLTLQIDEKEYLALPKAEIYPAFCDSIDENINTLKAEIENETNLLKDSEKKGEFLEKLGDLSRKLTFIQTMNLSKKSDELWQSELFSFLKELESLIEFYYLEGEQRADKLREELMEKFQSLQEG